MQDGLETGVKEDHSAVSHDHAAARVIQGGDPGVRWHLEIIGIYFFLNG